MKISLFAACRWLLLAGLSSTCISSLAQGTALAVEDFALQEWQLASFSCALPCEKPVQQAMQALLGSKMQIGPKQFSGALVESCDGTTEVVPRRVSRQLALEGLQDILGSAAKLDQAKLALPAEVLAATVYCQGTNGTVDGSLPRIISIQAQRMLLLFGEQIILELHRGQAEKAAAPAR